MPKNEEVEGRAPKGPTLVTKKLTRPSIKDFKRLVEGAGYKP